MNDNNDPLLSVSEIFGPTIQGEGPSQGRAVVFLRLGLCNLDCSWCDTPYTWDWTGKNGVKYDKNTELTKMPVSAIAERILDLMTPNGNATISRLVISGGEPLIQQRRLRKLIEIMSEHGVYTEIETNGTVEPIELLTLIEHGWVTFNCSPKLANSGIAHDTRIIPETLQTLAGYPTIFKFVIDHPNDINEIHELLDTHLPHVTPDRIYLMPKGTAANIISQQLPTTMETAAEHGWSISPRLHVLAYGNQRGI